MKSNVGGLDRIVRIGAGLTLVALAATGTVGMWGYIGIVPILTGTFKFCPAYTLLGMNTCPVNTK
jgi:NADH:ubiquinone oxidoreductase subunit 4 (subunit M)